MNKMKVLHLVIFFLFLVSCEGSHNEEKETDSTILVNREKIIEDNPIDYSEIEYTLPKSNYIYKIKIIEIETKIQKDAFITKEDEYSVPEKVDGYYLTLKIAMTNPYEKEMMVPIPDYYYITSENGEWFSPSTTNHKECHCKIDNSTNITNAKGKELYEISEGKCGYSNFCLKFNPKETKEFNIEFTDPIFGKVRKIAFNGFRMKWNNPSYTREQDKALIIDVDNKKIIGEKKF